MVNAFFSTTFAAQSQGSAYAPSGRRWAGSRPDLDVHGKPIARRNYDGSVSILDEGMFQGALGTQDRMNLPFTKALRYVVSGMREVQGSQPYWIIEEYDPESGAPRPV